MSEALPIPFYMGEDEERLKKMEEEAHFVFATSNQGVTFCIMFDHGSEHGFDEMLLHVKYGEIKACSAKEFQACAQMSGSYYSIDGGVDAIPKVKRKNLNQSKDSNLIRLPIVLYFDGRSDNSDSEIVRKWMSDPF